MVAGGKTSLLFTNAFCGNCGIRLPTTEDSFFEICLFLEVETWDTLAKPLMCKKFILIQKKKKKKRRSTSRKQEVTEQKATSVNKQRYPPPPPPRKIFH